MANLPESSAFDAGVYQIETNDPVLGGVDGTTNKPLRNLANRTKYLKDHVDALESTRAPTASPALTGTPTAPTAAADTSTTQLATTAFVLGQAGAVAPAMAGTAAAGTSARYARQDHVHPTDTTRAPLASPALTGTPTAPTAAAGTNTTQLATTAFVTAADAVLQTAINGKASAAHTHVIADVTGLQTALDGKLPVNGTAVALAGFTNSNSANPIAGADTATQNGVGYVSGMSLFGQTDGALHTQAYNANYVAQIFQDYRTGQMAARGKNNGTWTAWRTMLDTGNYNSIIPSLNGTGAYGTWSIDISGRGFPKRTDGVGLDFNWMAQPGTPTWIWGIPDGTNNYLYNPANFSVANAARSARLMRRDGADDFSIQHHWTGGRWRMRGYSGDTFHAEAEVGYSDLAGAVTDAGSSKAGNGWVKLPGSGIIIQWGALNLPLGNGATVSFPVAFPNACVNVYTTLDGYMNSVIETAVGLVNITSSNFYVSHWWTGDTQGYYANPAIVRWMAIGW